MRKQFCNTDRLDSLHDPARFDDLFFNIAARRKTSFCRFPCGIISFSISKSGNFSAGIILFSAAQCIISNGRICEFPAFIGNGSCFFIDNDITDQFRVIPPRSLVKTEFLRGLAVVPSISQNHGDTVSARLQKMSDIIDDIICPDFKPGNCGNKHAVIRLCSVDIKFMPTETAEEDFSRFNCFVYGEDFPENGCISSVWSGNHHCFSNADPISGESMFCSSPGCFFHDRSSFF